MFFFTDGFLLGCLKAVIIFPHFLKWDDLIFIGVALLPFVDERRLRAALEEVYPDLTPEESKTYTTLLWLWCIHQNLLFLWFCIALSTEWAGAELRQALSTSLWIVFIIRMILDGFIL